MRYILTFCLFVVSNNALSQTLTLEECVEMAVEKNISIKQSILDIENAAVDKSNAIGNFLPNFNAQSSHSWNVGLNQNITTGLLENLTTQFSSMGASIGMDIYNGLQNFNRLHRANLNILAKRYQLDDMIDDTKLLVANSYLQVLFNSEILNSQKSQLIVAKEQLKRTSSLIEAGVLPSGDLYELEANLASQEQSIVRAENNFILSKINLAQLLQISDYDNFNIVFEDLDIPFSQILEENPKSIFEKALTLRNDIKLGAVNIDIAEKDIELAKGTLQPTLRAFYSYSNRIGYSDRLVGTGDYYLAPIGTVLSSGETVVREVENRTAASPLSFSEQFQFNEGQNYGLSLNIPIFNGFVSKNSVKRAKINLERTKNSFERQKFDLESQINQAFNDSRGAYKFYEAAQKTVKSREIAFRNTQESFQEGVINSFDYVQAKQRYEQSLSDQIRAKFDYIFKLKVVEFYFGIPLSIE
ncbi:MAG: outer membrane protein [Candidatus Marivariicella framensis]|jgi:outer membrane protein|tara:strand:+ start:542 stop:1954 length:1413 start_codon:yes stop_codon:yes gene_type:complete